MKTRNPGEFKGSRIRRALQSLQTKILEFSDIKGWTSTQLIGGVRLSSNGLRVSFDISPLIKPFLFGLNRLYTTFELESVFRLSGKYSKRLYPMACQFKSSQIWVLVIDDLHRRLNLSESYRDNFGAVYNRVVRGAIDEINEKTDITISEKTRTKKPGSKSVHSITFHIILKNAHQKSQEDSLLMDSLIAVDLAPWQCERVLKTIAAVDIRKLLYSIHLARTNHKINVSLGAYSSGCFKQIGVSFEGKKGSNTEVR
jgi:plasmid replication initiation protein